MTLRIIVPELVVAGLAIAVIVTALTGMVPWGELDRRLRFLPYAAPFALAYTLFSIARTVRDVRRQRAVGEPAPAELEPAGDDPIPYDRFLIEQRVRFMVNQYDVFTLHEDGRSRGRRVCFVEQKRLALKEDLRAFTHDAKTAEVFRIKARQVFDPRARYDVTDPDGRRIGQLAKVFGRSLLRSTWELFDANGRKVGWAQERSVPVALWRRFVDLIPFAGELLSWIPVRYHFDYHAGERRVGSFERRFGLRDRYLLDLSADSERTIDRRLAIALAVGLDALQAR